MTLVRLILKNTHRDAVPSRLSVSNGLGTVSTDGVAGGTVSTDGIAGGKELSPRSASIRIQGKRDQEGRHNCTFKTHSTSAGSSMP